MGKGQDGLDRLDLMSKVITRTDGFHNYANTKSTVILTFTTAVLAIFIANLSKFYEMLGGSTIPQVKLVFTLLVIAEFLLLFFALIFISKTLIPNTEKSKTKNIYSFVDIYHNFNEDEYRSEVSNIDTKDLIVSMCDLQYNLSKSLNGKYANHKKSVWCLTSALKLSLVLFLILILA
ncbi:UNVERIFIED_ORG: ABC-type nickel/cobalt efflux system permease component RcnA [Rahnella aquatilis]